MAEDVSAPKQLQQIPVILKTAAALLALSAIYEIVVTLMGAVLGMMTDMSGMVFYALELFLAFNLLKGRRWARAWILGLSFLGIIGAFVELLFAGDIFMFIFQIIFLSVMIILLDPY